MPSPLETLVKILKLEQDTGYQDKAVIGGLKSFAANWAADAHTQAKKPEHHALVDELAGVLNGYGETMASQERTDAIKYMLGRITGRIPPPAGVPPRAIELAAQQSPPSQQPMQPSQPQRPPRRDEPRESSASRGSDQRSSDRAARQDRPEQQREQNENHDGYRQGQPQQVERRGLELPQRKFATPTNAETDHPRDPFHDDEDFGEAPSENDTYIAEQPVPRQHQQGKVKPQRRKRGQRDPRRDVEAMQAVRKSVGNLNGIGPKMAEKLEQIGINTIEDLLYCLPRRYDDYTRMVPLSRLQPDQTVTVIGMVRNVVVIKGKRNIDILSVTIDDGAGVMTASFFGQPYLRSKLERGTQVVFSGKTELFRGQITMSNPEWELLEREALHTRAIVPVYPLTKGLTAHNMRKFARTALEQWSNQLPDFMPESVLERTDLSDLSWAIQNVHFPTSMEALDHAHRRLSFDQLIILQLGVLRNRRDWQSVPGTSMNVSDEWLNGAASALPYALTGAQVRAIQAIREDMARAVPMNRLLQGDVGAGKTVVAAVSMAIAVASGYQAAIMAPTSILAEQHYRGISKLLANMPGGDTINVKLLTGSTPTQERSETLWGLGEGTVNIIIGTHALLESGVNFKNLGLIVIDEQHRFGVEQRGKLRGKGQNPHVLVMTATPIPRTLALTMYADLDLTILDEMPPGRTPIDTRMLYPKERERAYSFIGAQLDKGRQAFIVYPLVEASDSESLAEVRSAVEDFERLQKEVFPKRKLGLLHGRMSPSEKDAVMEAFGRGETEILVSTSVVEVGIDVPNASVMLIEGANRFGLAQLHQFRGRVGRGEHQSFCLLIADDGDDTNARLKAMEETTDGFKLAEIDWELRGAGDLLGTRQSGGAARLGEYMAPKLVEEAQFEARTIYEEDPDLSMPEHALLRELLRQRFGDQSTADVS